MTRVALAISLTLAVALALDCDAAAASSVKRIYRIDSCAAVISGNRISIVASGAAVTGGWSNPQLRARRAPHRDKNVLVFEFVASPPPSKKAVVQALVPMNAKLTMHLPHNSVRQIEIDAEMNSSIAQVIGH